MAQIRSTTGGNYAKYNAFVEKMILESMNKHVPVEHGTNKKYIIKRTKKNKDSLDRYLKESLKGGNGPLNDILLDTTDGAQINFGSLTKPKFRAVANKGDVAEGIFSSALYAKFKSKSKNIKVQNVYDVLDEARNKLKVRGGKRRTVEISLKEKSENKNGVVYDDISLKIILAESNMHSLLDSSVWNSELSDIFNSAVAYANSKTVQYWADLLWKNNQKNLIEVISAGTEDQTGTKVDVFVLIDRKKVDINVSLKAGDVKQFGQLGGTDFEKIQKMWKYLDVDISKDKKKYYEFLSKKDVVGGFNVIYNTVANKKTFDTTLFSDFVKYNATLRESGVTLVQLSRNAKIYDFEKLKKLKGMKISVKKKKDSTGKPFVIFYNGNTELLKIRMKIENKPTSEFGVYVRTYIEKLQGLTDLLAETI